MRGIGSLVQPRRMSLEEQTAVLLDSVLGEHLSDVALADLVDEILDTLAARVAAV